MLGPLLICTGGGNLTLPSAKQRALLATLLLEAPHDVSAERLIDELWGEDPPASAGKALQVHVSQLRRALGPGQPIATRPTGYAIHVDPAAVDIHRLDALLVDARRLRGSADASGALHALEDALLLWRGPALADVTLLGPGVTEADRLEGLRAVAHEERMELELEQGGGAALVPELEALVAAHPYRERMHGLLMRALYRAGRQADALEAFRRARRRLLDDLGLEPGPELVALEAAVLAQDPSLGGAPGPPASPAPPASPPPPASPSPTASPSPPAFPAPAVLDAAVILRPPTAIVGRAAELERALALLASADVRLVTLTGAGGIGKTRLALELAARLGERSRFVELAAVGEAERVVPAISAALAVEDPAEDAIGAALGGLGAVVFLDNFEQVLDAAPAVGRLLGRVPDLRVVVTSRAPLRIAGEHELPVPPLGPDPAVELFLSRVRERDPEFSPASNELTAVDGICARIDRLPLAIELAAARARVLAPVEMLERIGRRLEILTAGRRDAPERHRTLRATIAWSHDLLSPAEQRLFAELAVFPSGCALEACEAVGSGDVLDLLSGLVDQSLVIRDGGRFFMLETVREYAAERLAELPDAEAVRRRHAQWCAMLADAAEPELAGPGQAAWFARLDAEQENLRAACAWSVASGEPGVALRIGGALWRYWLARVVAAEMIGVLRAALASGEGDAQLRAKALNAAGVLAGATDDFATARGFFEQALTLVGARGDRRQMARALGNLGLIMCFEQDFGGAVARYSQAVEIWRELGDVLGESRILQNLAVAHFSRDELEPALRDIEQSVELARVAGDPMHIASVLIALGQMLAHRRPTDERIPVVLHEALELSAGLGERLQTAECLEAVARFAASVGEPSLGSELVGAADAERARIGARRKPDEQKLFAETDRELVRALGPVAYERGRERGRQRGLEASVELALVCTDQAGGAQVTALADHRARHGTAARVAGARRR